MTLTIGIIAQDGIVLAADDRATVGDPRGQTAINEPVKKIFAIGKHSGIGIAGDSGLILTIIDEFKKDVAYSGEMAISERIERLRLKCVELYNKWFPHLKPEERPDLALIVAGYTSGGDTQSENEQNSEIYNLGSYDNFAPRKMHTGFQAIGLTRLANYILNTLYRPEINIKKAAQLAAFSIKETSSQDAKVGSNIQVATFSNQKNYFEHTRTELDNLEKACDAFREGMREQIYGKAAEETKEEKITEDKTEIKPPEVKPT